MKELLLLINLLISFIIFVTALRENRNSFVIGSVLWAACSILVVSLV